MTVGYCSWRGVVGALVAALTLASPAGWCVVCGGMCGGLVGAPGLTTFTTGSFSGSGICAVCHDNLVDVTLANVSIAAHWRSTMMANSAKDPLWQAKMSTEVVRNPAIAPVIEEKCSRCHTPMARVQAAASSAPVSLLNGGFLDPENALNQAAMDGISCSLCHQIQDTNLGVKEGFSGHYVIDTGTSPPDRAMFGQYAQPFFRPMMMMSGFTPVQGGHMGDSALCGACHTLYTPSRDEAGDFTREFPEQMTYPEWQHAVNGGGATATCVDCHMPKAAGVARLSTMPMRLSPRPGFVMHHFTGANIALLGLLQANVEALGLTATSAQLGDSISRTLAVLGAKTADLTISGASVTKKSLRVSVKVANKTGHKFPTGVPFRRAWIDLSVRDAAGRVFFESGRPNADGSIRGCDADGPGGGCEPHHKLITRQDQVQIYESVMGDLSGAVTYTLLDSVSYVKDNRLLPAGFSKSSASGDIAVVGEAEGDPNFIGGGDVVRYKIRTNGRPRPFTVTATLYYQTVSFAGVRDLLKTDTPQVRTFADMYAAAGVSPTVIKSTEITVR